MEETSTIEIKKGDIFKISYTEIERQKRRNFDLGHCFEGVAIAKETSEGVKLFDCYWGRGDESGKRFCQEDIGRVINAEYVANMSDILIMPDAERNYDDKDIITLSEQRRSTVYTYIRKGAQKSAQKMIQTCEQTIFDSECAIRSHTMRIEQQKRLIEQIKKGNREIYV